MDLNDIFADKSKKPKDAIKKVSEAIASGKLGVKELVSFAKTSTDPVKAGCIEALEFASKKDPSVINVLAFDFVTEQLSHKAPRIKWESAKVIGNCAHLFKKKLNDPVRALLENSEHAGTVVRWSAAFALGEIIKLNMHPELIKAAEAIIKREEKNSIRKIYLAAIKTINGK